MLGKCVHFSIYIILWSILEIEEIKEFLKSFSCILHTLSLNDFNPVDAWRISNGTNSLKLALLYGQNFLRVWPLPATRTESEEDEGVRDLECYS